MNRFIFPMREEDRGGPQDPLVHPQPRTASLLHYLGRDPIRNAYPIYFASREPERCRIWTAEQEGEPQAHLLIYEAREFGLSSAYWGGCPPFAEELVRFIPTSRCEVTLDTPLLDCLRGGEGLRGSPIMTSWPWPRTRPRWRTPRGPPVSTPRTPGPTLSSVSHRSPVPMDMWIRIPAGS